MTTDKQALSLSLYKLAGLPVLVFVLLLPGCSILPEAEPADSMHMLEWRGDGTAQTNEGRGSLQVAMPVAYPGYDSSYIRYRRGDSARLDRYARNRWVDRPAVLIGAATTEAMDQQGHFQRVVPPGNPIAAQFRLETDLVRLEQIFDGNDSRVYLTVRYRLLEVGSGRILGSVRHELDAEAEGNPSGAVDAANRLLNESLQRLVEELSAWRSEG